MEGVLQPPRVPQRDPGTLPGGGQHPSRGRGADGGDFGAAGGLLCPSGPRFDLEVKTGGYCWWYLDGLSDDGGHGITIIAFIGSVFSPYYAWARRHGRGDPRNHCAINVALYKPRGGKRWSLTERGRSSLNQSPERLEVGPSALHWDGDALTVEINERAAPLPHPIRGRVRVHPHALTHQDFLLDGSPNTGADLGGRHRWWPIAPCARLEIEMSEPRLHWSGSGYLDMNAGDEPIEDGFRCWDWSRADLDGDTAILYDIWAADGATRGLALRIDRGGAIEPFRPPPRVPLPRSLLWRIGRGTRCETGGNAAVRQTLEDTPFYARSVVSARLLGRPVRAMHESLSLKRFASPWVQALLPFRMPRVTR